MSRGRHKLLKIWLTVGPFSWTLRWITFLCFVCRVKLVCVVAFTINQTTATLNTIQDAKCHRLQNVMTDSRAETELGHILWPSDPVTRESSDPETQLTWWLCSIMNSKCRLMCEEVFSGQSIFIIIGKSKSSLHGLTSSDFSITTDTWQWLCHFSISNVRFAFYAFFRKPENLGSHTGSKWWPGNPYVKDDPNDPLTRWPNDPVPCLIQSYRFSTCAKMTIWIGEYLCCRVEICWLRNFVVNRERYSKRKHGLETTNDWTRYRETYSNS